MKVTKFTHEGKTYLKSEDNDVYDDKTQDLVGKWNAETKEIEMADDELETEDEESDEEDDE